VGVGERTNPDLTKRAPITVRAGAPIAVLSASPVTEIPVPSCLAPHIRWRFMSDALSGGGRTTSQSRPSAPLPRESEQRATCCAGLVELRAQRLLRFDEFNPQRRSREDVVGLVKLELPLRLSDLRFEHRLRQRSDTKRRCGYSEGCVGGGLRQCGCCASGDCECGHG
jgi:hypothetical protein